MDLKAIAKQNNWKLKKLDKVTFFQEGPGVRNHQYTTNGVKLLNVANLFEGQLDLSRSDRFISEEEAHGKYSHFLVDEGDLIIACSGIQVDYFHKKMGFAKKEHLPLCMNTSTMRFKTLDENILDLQYLACFLKTNFFKNQIQRLITGSAQLNFGPSHIKKIDILIPPLEIQKKIVEGLDKARSLIDARKEQIRLMDELIQSIFFEMFGESEINSLNWPMHSLVELCKVGSSKRIYKNEQTMSGIPFLRISDLMQRIEKDIEVSDLFISLDKFTELKEQKLVPNVGEILVTSRGTLGECYIIKKTDNFYFQDGMISWLSNISDSILPEYILYLFKTKGIKRQIERSQSGSTVAYLSITMLKQLEIMLPPVERQQQFVDYIQKIDKLKVDCKVLLDETQLLYDSLIQQYFK